MISSLCYSLCAGDATQSLPYTPRDAGKWGDPEHVERNGYSSSGWPVPGCSIVLLPDHFSFKEKLEIWCFFPVTYPVLKLSTKF